MKPIDDETLSELEQTAVHASRAIRAYLAYQGSNTSYRDKARVSAAAISAFARARSSESNRQAVELMAARVLSSSTNQLPPRGKDDNEQ